MDVSQQQPTIPKKEAIVFRCKECGKLLAKNGDHGHLEIKCPRCDTLNREIESVLGQMIITDPDGRIVHINHITTAVTGYTLDEAIGQRPSDLWGGQMTAEFYVSLWRTIKEEKKPFIGRITNKNKHGDMYDVEMTITPILNTSGEVLFYICVEALQKTHVI